MMAMMQGAMGGGMGGAAPNPMMAALMGGMGMGGAMPVVTGNLDQSTKTLRELFVGNTPEGTQEGVLMEFLNQVCQGAYLCTLRNVALCGATPLHLTRTTTPPRYTNYRRRSAK